MIPQSAHHHPHPPAWGSCAWPFLLLAAVSAPEVAAQDAFSPALTVTATWNDNLSRTSYYADEREAGVYSIGGSIDRRVSLNRDVALLLGGDVRGEICPRFSGLDNIAAGPRADLQRKFGLGPFAPLLSFNTAASAIAARESYRRGWSAVAKLGFSKRLSNVLRAELSAEWTRHDLDEPVYDREIGGLSAEIKWDVTPRWQLGLGAGRQDGEQIAYASGSCWDLVYNGGAGPAEAAYYQSVPSVSSKTFGSDWVAYRIDGRTDSWWISLSPALAANTALPLRYERVEVRGYAGSRYVSHIISLSWVRRF